MYIRLKVMGETERGYEYDISFDPDTGEDVIVIDAGDSMVYLTPRDMDKMRQELWAQS